MLLGCPVLAFYPRAGSHPRKCAIFSDKRWAWLTSVIA
jgi:hypothetical protein